MLQNILFFQLIWFGNILLGNIFIAVAMVLFLLHFNFVKYTDVDLKIMTTCMLLGITIDSLLMLVGVFSFGSGLVSDVIIPPWLIVIWAAFGMTLNHSLFYLQERPLMAFLIGCIVGPLSYIGGAKLGGIELHYAYWPTFVIFSIIWGPLLWALTQWVKTLNYAHFQKPYIDTELDTYKPLINYTKDFE